MECALQGIETYHGCPGSAWPSRPSFSNSVIPGLRGFYNERLSSLADLKSKLSQKNATGVLAIDVEGSGTNVHQVGLAYIPAHVLLDSTKETNVDIRSYMQQNKGSLYVINIRTRTEDETERWGSGQMKGARLIYVPPADVALVVERVMEELGSSKNFIMAAYNIRAEFRWLTTCCPKILHHFDCWIDLEPHIGSISKRTLSLTNSLRLLNIPHDAEKKHGFRKHNAGIDAVHTLRLLHRYLCDTPTIASFGPVPITGQGRNHFAFKALIRSITSIGLPPSICLASNMMEYFAQYNPIHCHQHSKSKFVINAGFLCFNTLQELNHFIQEVNGTVIENRTMQVKRYHPHGSNLTELPPNINNADAQKLLLKGKLENRQQKKLENVKMESDMDALVDLFAGDCMA